MTSSTNWNEDSFAVAPLEELAELAEKVSQAIAKRVKTSAGPTEYGSRRPYPPPPGKTHRWMREHGRELEAFGAVRTGGRRGRTVVYTISSSGWRQYEASLKREPRPALTKALIDPARWIAEAGHRATRTGGAR